MTNPFYLDGAVAFISGASSGLGRHFALTLARAGAKVAVAARRMDRLQDLVAEIEGFDGRALAVSLDVTDQDSVIAAVGAAETELGAITVLVNNAGVGGAKPALETDLAAWNRIIDANLTGAWLLAQETARHMVRLGHGGSIINIASMMSHVVRAQVPAYCASKAGLAHLTRALAVELAANNIRVNAIAPGYFETDLSRPFLETEAGARLVERIPQKRVGEMGELDGVLLLLASDASSYMTGTVTTVDGGYTIS